MKEVGLFIPFIILIIMELLTIEKIYTFIGMDMVRAGQLGITNTFFIFPLIFFIYGIYCSKCGKEAILPIIITFILFIIIIVSFYMKFISLELCLISVPTFVIGFIFGKENNH